MRTTSPGQLAFMASIIITALSITARSELGAGTSFSFTLKKT